MVDGIITGLVVVRRTGLVETITVFLKVTVVRRETVGTRKVRGRLLRAVARGKVRVSERIRVVRERVTEGNPSVRDRL